MSNIYNYTILVLCLVLAILFLCARTSLIQKPKRNILLLGPKGSGKTCLQYSLCGENLPTTYASLKESRCDLTVFPSQELPGFTKTKKLNFFLHDVPGMKFNKPQIEKFLRDNNLMESPATWDLVFVIDGTMLLNNQYLEQFSNCLVDILFLKRNLLAMDDHKVKAMVVLTKSDNPLFMQEKNAEDLIRKKVRTVINLRVENSAIQIGISPDSRNPDLRFVATNKNENLRPALIKWVVESS